MMITPKNIPCHRFASRALAWCALCGLLLAASGCALLGRSSPIPTGGPAVPSDNTAILANGTQLMAATPDGEITIEAGPGLRRIFTWDGTRRGVITEGRTRPFANGTHKGLTYNGTPALWENVDGVKSLHYEEGDRDFENVDDALIWMQIRQLYFTYNDTGLAVGVSHDANTLHVEVWQFTIDGKKPTTLPKARDNTIVVESI